MRVHDETTAERVVEITRILRQGGFERVTLSSLEPMRHVAQTRKEWGRSAEDCPFAERLDSAMATLEIEGDGLGGIGSVKILSQDFQDAAYSGALCLSAMPFPTDVAPKWRLRMRRGP
ncbi:MAG: hypothetical protein JST00_09755 [Deltaproteobacteria bacterium]|nr:hypothetical protein [Deltaproteobacteria bacterium]